MRVVLLLCVVLLAARCGSSPVPDDRLEQFRPRRQPQFIKGQKGNRAPDPLNLRKGEYICGNKICSLRPGQIPPNCNGVCQYKVVPTLSIWTDVMRPQLQFFLVIALAAWMVSTMPPPRPPRWLSLRMISSPGSDFASDRTLRKGEYVCGDRICSLQPGQPGLDDGQAPIDLTDGEWTH